MNSQYEVFKCLYNGETPGFPTGQNATYEPSSQPVGGQERLLVEFTKNHQEQLVTFGNICLP